MDKDPNGLAAAVTTLVIASAAIFSWAVDDETAQSIGQGVAGVVALGAIIAARRKAWAPDAVAALDPTTVGDAGELPEAP